MNSQSLNGKWSLYYADTGRYTIDDYSKFDDYNIPHVEATVPGNVELDLSKAGVLPEDLFMGNVINEEVRKIETWEWWYKTEFSCDDSFIKSPTAQLVFEAVDCYAEYYLNGALFGTSENALIEHKFDVSGLLKEHNTLIVHIRSTVWEETKQKAPNTLYKGLGYHHVPDYILSRRAPHTYGWDIMPRAISAGLWRGVSLETHGEYEITDMFLYPTQIFSPDNAVISAEFETNLPPELFLSYSNPPTITMTAVFEDKKYDRTASLTAKNGNTVVGIPNPKLWWPRGYGKQNLYDITLTIKAPDGTVLCEKTVKYGLRKVELHNDEVATQIEGRFFFKINGVEVYCQGSNWVPLDPYHSRDAEKYEEALGLFYDCGCNIVRCWGGNVYEDRRFYELCDQYGIMVWQDFSMACNFYPQEQWFYDMMAEETEAVVKKLRNYCSIILWSGDNECDSGIVGTGIDPNKNKITREVIPNVITTLDQTRPYLPSSPYISEKVFEVMKKSGLSSGDVATEIHAWGPRDYYKASFYQNNTASFISETGYHGCPSPKSIKKFITPDKVFPYFDNNEWNLHSTDKMYSDHRVMLMHNQVLQLFGKAPDNLEDYSTASQISQAEAKKFFIERLRARRPHSSGIIWWNMLDGWPQMSDAVVDYYFDKKLAYHYIKKAQRDFSLFFGEVENWGCPIFASNCTLEQKTGKYKITCVDDGKVYLEGSFNIVPNENKKINMVKIMYSEKKLFIIEWTLSDGTSGRNHYLAGYPPFDFDTYKNKYLPAIMEDVK